MNTKKSRIAALHCLHESNSFSPMPTTLADYVFYDFRKGDLSPAAALGAGSEMTGFMEVMTGQNVDAALTIGGCAPSGGNLTAQAVADLHACLLDALRSTGPVDGVYLALHGATVSDGHPDVTGEILAAARRLYGPDVPIICSLDFHANVTSLMARSCNAIVGYRTFPHVDTNTTGRRAASLLLSAVRGEVRPRNVLVRLPMILPAEVTGDRIPPMAGLIRQVHALDGRPGIASASLFCVQPWLDVADLGCSVVVVADGDVAAARQAALGLASDYWGVRREFTVPLVSPAAAVGRVLASPGLVVLCDSADATTSGASGDSTAILEEMVKQQAPGPCLVTVTDEPAVAQAVKAGVGARLDLEIGGKYDRKRYKTLRLQVEVVSLHDGHFVGKSPMGTGRHFNMGRTAVLRAGNVFIVATSRAEANMDPELYRSVGLEPATARAVVVKSPLGFRAAYTPIVREIVMVDGPGSVTPHLAALPFTRPRPPLYPLDDVVFQPSVTL